MSLKALAVALLCSLVFYGFLGVCGYAGYKWAMKDAKKAKTVVWGK